MANIWVWLPTEIQIVALKYAIYADEALKCSLDNCPRYLLYSANAFAID